MIFKTVDQVVISAPYKKNKRKEKKIKEKITNQLKNERNTP